MAKKHLTFRMPEDLHEHVQQIAREDMRSLNAEIIVLLREAVAARGGRLTRDEMVRVEHEIQARFPRLEVENRSDDGTKHVVVVTNPRTNRQIAVTNTDWYTQLGTFDTAD